MTSASGGAPQPSAIAKLLASLNATFSDPYGAGLTGFAQGLLQASAPHMLTPVSGGQALGMGAASSQQYQAQALQNALQRAVLPMTIAKTGAITKTLSKPNSYAGRTFVDNILGGQAAVSHDPNVVGPATLAETQNQFHTLGANARGFGPPLPQDVGAIGSLPEGSVLGGVPGTPGGPELGSLNLSLIPGASDAITANAYNKAGGAAAGSYPVNAALSYHTRAPGAAGGTLGPRPAAFAPMGGAPPTPGTLPTSPATPTPAALAAAQAAARQRQMGTVQGVSQAAQSAGVPAPIASSPSRGSGTNANPNPPGTLAASQEVWRTPQGRAQAAAGLNAALAAQGAGARAPLTAPQGGRPVVTLPRPQPPTRGNGLNSPGLSPAQVELQKEAASQTGAQEAEGTKETEAAQAQLARLNEMQQTLTQIPVGGNLAKVYAGIGDVLNYANVKLPGLEAIQEFTKYRTNFVADAARKMGSRISYQEVSYLAKGVPDFTLTGNAPKALLAQLSGAAQYDISRNQAMQYYATKVPNLYGKPYQGTTRGFEQWWQKSGVTPGAFMFMNTLASLAPADRGEYLQNFRGNATGRVYLQQYAKAQAFLRQNPGLVPFWSPQQ